MGFNKSQRGRNATHSGPNEFFLPLASPQLLTAICPSCNKRPGGLSVNGYKRPAHSQNWRSFGLVFRAASCHRARATLITSNFGDGTICTAPLQAIIFQRDSHQQNYSNFMSYCSSSSIATIPTYAQIVLFYAIRFIGIQKAK